MIKSLIIWIHTNKIYYKTKKLSGFFKWVIVISEYYFVVIFFAKRLNYLKIMRIIYTPSLKTKQNKRYEYEWTQKKSYFTED